MGPGADTLGVDERWLTQYRVRATAGSVHVVPLATARPDHGWLLGIGQGGVQHWRAAGGALIRATSTRVAGDAVARPRASRTVQVHLPPGTTAHQAAALALGCVVGSHRYRFASGDRPPWTTTVRLVAPPGHDPQPLASAVARAQVLGHATGLARDLANTPSGHKDPRWLAATAARLAATVPGLQATVRDDRWLAEHGFGGVLAVGGGSARPPRLLELAWRPLEVNTEEHLVLVGKGITFDTGGISIKPADNMHLMRTDMSGGAAVIAALLAVGQLKLPLRVTGLVPCAENHVSGSALRPGDVVQQVGGTTTEVSNTDAEGRLVLADAL
ncbi:MAG: leucyl aminopeptidase family protein, partial [Pseudonocardiaceae bacterium]